MSPSRYYLNEEPVINNVDPFRLEEKEAREHVLDRLDELVVRPVDGPGGKGLVIGPDASQDEFEALRKRIIADPRGWIAQPVLQLSTVPRSAATSSAPGTWTCGLSR
jgi:uncharacterized circularly permuted ATP-grasp superfamily protein